MPALVGLLQVLGCLVLCALRVITGALGELVFIYRALALAGDIEDFAEIDVRPDFRPFRLDVAVERFAEFIRGRLIIVLQKNDRANPVVGERAVFVWSRAPSGIP